MQPKTFKIRNEAGLELTIRDVRIEDAPTLVQWMRSSETAQTIASVFSLSQESEVDWIKNSYTDKKKFLMGLEYEGKLVGTWSAAIDDHTATTGSLIGLKEFRGRGIGTLAHTFRTWYLFTRWAPVPVFKIKSHVLWDLDPNFQNPASKKALEKVGYVVTGTMYGEIFRNGSLCDLIHLECFNPNFFGEDNPRAAVSESVKKVKEVLQFVETHIDLV